MEVSAWAPLTAGVNLAQQFGGPLKGNAVVDRQRQFTVRDLLLLTFACGFGLFAYRRLQNIPEALLTGIGVVVATSITIQARDLARSWRHCPPELRGSMLFALGWRLWLAALLILTFIAAARGTVAGEDLPHFLHGWRDLAQALVLLSLLIIVSQFTSDARERAWPAKVLLYMGGTAGLLMLLVVQAFLYYLVYIAVRGVEADQPLHFMPQPVDDVKARHTGVFWASLATLALIPLLLLGLFGLIARLSRNRSVWLPSLVLVATLLLAWLYAGWFYGWALPGLSRSFASAVTMKPLWVWVAGVALTLTFTGALAYRCVSQRGTMQECSLRWRSGGVRYLHEHPLILATTSAAAFWLIAQMLREHEYSWEAALLYALAPQRSVLLLAIALGLLAGSATFRVRRHLLREESQRITPLPMRRFLGIWLGMLLVLTTAAMILGAVSFAVWLNPWMYRG